MMSAEGLDRGSSKAVIRKGFMAGVRGGAVSLSEGTVTVTFIKVEVALIGFFMNLRVPSLSLFTPGYESVSRYASIHTVFVPCLNLAAWILSPRCMEAIILP
jgi:hypothetical protein